MRAKPLEPEQVAAFRHAREEAGMWPVVVHVNYLVNVATPKEELYDLSCDVLGDELARAQAIGADIVVMHPGHHLGTGIDEAITRVAAAIDRAYEQSDSQVTLCIENMAGAGTEVGRTFAELKQIIDSCRHGDLLGVCFDTCHAFAAGYDVATPEGLDATLDEISSTVGLQRVKMVHANDAMGTLGSGKDRHHNIGKGNIGLRGFTEILSRPAMARLPFILETPVNSPEDQERDLAAIRSCVP